MSRGRAEEDLRRFQEVVHDLQDHHESEVARLRREMVWMEKSTEIEARCARQRGCVVHMKQLAEGDVIARLYKKANLCKDCSVKCLDEQDKVLSINNNVARVEWKKQKPLIECIGIFLLDYVLIFGGLSVMAIYVIMTRLLVTCMDMA